MPGRISRDANRTAFRHQDPLGLGSGGHLFDCRRNRPLGLANVACASRERIASRGLRRVAGQKASSLQRPLTTRSALTNTGAGERLRLRARCSFSNSPRRNVVHGAAPFDDDVDCVVVRPDPDHVAVRVDDGTERPGALGEHRDARK